jgi:AcrR family transcriptional regulator
MSSRRRASCALIASPAGQLFHPRRRGSKLHEAIYDAVISELAENGFAGMTMEGVAARAHTGKASLYRRWPTREALVLDALESVVPPICDMPDTGGVRDDLLTYLEGMAAALDGPFGVDVLALVGEKVRRPDLVEAIRGRLREPRVAVLLQVLQRGIARGEVRPEAVTPCHAEVGPTLLLHRFLESGTAIPPKDVAAIVDDVLMPMLRPVPVAAAVPD